MPKKNKSKRMTDVVTVEFHHVQPATLSSGQTFTPVSMASSAVFGDRITAEADLYCHWKLDSFKFRILATGSITATQAVAFIPGAQDTVLGTVDQLSQTLNCALMGSRQTVHSDWVNVPKADIAGPLPWYKTIPGTADTTEETIGNLSFVGTAAETVTIETRGRITFKGAVNAAQTPEFREVLRRLHEQKIAAVNAREREMMVRVLALPAPPTAFSAK